MIYTESSQAIYGHYEIFLKQPDSSARIGFTADRPMAAPAPEDRDTSFGLFSILKQALVFLVVEGDQTIIVIKPKKGI